MPEKIVITADSTCDLSEELVRKYDIKILPLYVIMDSKSYKDGVDCSPEDIYKYFESTGNVAKTSAVSVDDYARFFKEHTADGASVVHLNISLGFSSCHQNAVIASKEFSGVYPVDSKNLSTGIGLLVIKAAILRDEGLSAEEIVKQLNETVDKVEASFVVDTLTYLHRGGRCSAVAKLGANLLKLKPSIEVKDGLMHVGKKFRGTLYHCIDEYVTLRLSGRNDIDKTRVFITHTACDSSIVENVRKKLEAFGFEEILETVAGCTITSHCGPGTLGILFIRK